VKYEATYVVLAEIAIGEANETCCQPVADSPVKVAVPRRAPPAVHRCPTCVPVFSGPL
jgi:hypothetical protein